MHDIEQLSLVLMQTLYLYIKDKVRAEFDMVMLLDILDQTELVLILDLAELFACLGILCQRGNALDLGQIGDPGIGAQLLCYPVSQKRIAVQEESSLGDAVCLVIELLRHHLIEVAQLTVLEDFSMQSCNTIYGEAAHDRHIGHADLTLVKDGHVLDLAVLVGILLLDLLHESAIDLIHDLVYTGKQTHEQVYRPFLQGFRHDGVVGVCAASGYDGPCVIPFQVIIIYKDTHQLRYSYRRMGIVELEYSALGQLVNIVMGCHKTLYNLLQGCRYEEILLLETKLLAAVVVIIGIKNIYDRLCQILLLYRLGVVTLVKGIQVELSHRLGIPDSQGVYDAVIVTYDRQIIGHGQNGLIAVLHVAVPAQLLVILDADIAAEFDSLGILRTFDFERIAVSEPVIGQLNLLAVYDGLLEHTVFVTDTAAVSRIVEGGQGLQEAGCQTAKAAVSQTCIRLLILNLVDINAEFLKNLSYLLVAAKVDQVIAQGSAHQEFHGKIEYLLGIMLGIGLVGPEPVINDPVLCRIGYRLENLLLRSSLQGLAETVLEFCQYIFFDFYFI